MIFAVELVIEIELFPSRSVELAWLTLLHHTHALTAQERTWPTSPRPKAATANEPLADASGTQTQVIPMMKCRSDHMIMENVSKVGVDAVD